MPKIQRQYKSNTHEKRRVEPKTKKSAVRRYAPIGKIILAAIGMAGILSIAVLAPNSMQMLKLFGFGKRGKKKYTAYEIESALERLKANGFVWLQEKDGGMILRLTREGEEELRQYKLQQEHFQTRRSRRWDKKWRVVIFDIEENQKDTRNMLRKSLIDFGFERLQNSVWIYPHDCEEIIMLLKANFEMGKEVLYMVVDRVENDEVLREKFGLA